jgi:signal transduction histidine kinase
MRGYLETLSMSEVRLDDPTRDRYLRIVDEETRRLERIVGDLLDLAKLEGAAPSFEQRDVDIAGLFERVAARHERELAERRIQLTRLVEPGAGTISGDPERLEQALQNLAGNALRYTPNGGRIALEAKRIRLGESNAGQVPAGTRLTVRDNGPGIPPEHLPLIFDRFYKADASRTQSGGSGLGLSIAKTIVERHGGTISARNDGGAVFEIALPN